MHRVRERVQGAQVHAVGRRAERGVRRFIAGAAVGVVTALMWAAGMYLMDKDARWEGVSSVVKRYKCCEHCHTVNGTCSMAGAHTWPCEDPRCIAGQQVQG